MIGRVGTRKSLGPNGALGNPKACIEADRLVYMTEEILLERGKQSPCRCRPLTFMFKI
jgi:hypothetical protein